MKSVNYLILVHVTFERLKNRKVGKYAHVLSSTNNMHFFRTERQIKKEKKVVFQAKDTRSLKYRF